MNLLLLEPDQLQGDRAQVSDARRLRHVQAHLRLQVGDTLKVGVRDGQKGTGRVAHLDAEYLQLDKVVLDQHPPAKRPVTLIVALPRPKVLRRVVMDAVTLGVERLILLHSLRVEKSYWQTPFLQQLDEFILLGLEQAGDTVWPELLLRKRFKPFVEDELPGLCAGRLALVAHPYALEPMPAQVNQPVTLVIGCEGGFIPYEIDLLAKHGCQPVSLGPRILRTETAMAHVLGRLG